MCRKIRNNFVITFSYVSVIAIGILIYLVIFLFAEKRQQGKYMANDFVTFPTKKAESSKDFAKKDSALNELPNEIDSAMNAIEAPADSAKNGVDSAGAKTSAKSSAESSAGLKSSAAFPRDFIVDAKILNVRASAHTNAKIIKRFKQGAIISIRNIKGQWAELANGGFAFAPLLKEMPKKSPAKSIKKQAKNPKNAESSVDSAKTATKQSADSAILDSAPKSPHSQNLTPKNPAK